ncbi:MAG: hypothetical protein OXI61_08195 [Candidatus Poribacteria bacterium]|nr:hypothetical protein [Candidatus Poribacteria bacterium]
MKIPKTLFFMVLNPIPLIVHLTWWSLFFAWVIVSDDPFIEMVWPRIVQITEPPASVGNYVTAGSIIFDEIIKEFTSNGGVYFFIFIILPCTIISYREARGNLQGIAKEQQTWMRWYHRQQETIVRENTFEESPPASEGRKVNSYFRKTLRALLSMTRNPMPLIVHFAYWFSAFTLFFAVIFTATEWAGIVDTAREFVKMLPEFAIPPLVLALLSSYQETRGTVKGIIKVRQMWAEWYYRRQEAKAQGVPFEMSPPLLHIY